MKNHLLILAGAAALSLASCSQEKTTEVTTTVPAATDATATAAPSDAEIEARAQRIADKMVADMKISDEATKTKIRTIYVNRYRQMGEMRSKYTTDTTGMASAMREANAATDAEFKTVFTDPTQYQAYESSRSSYYDMEDDDMSSSDMSSSDAGTSTDASASSGSMDASTSSDGGKVKVKADGDIKVKDAEGNKMKVDGDDGTVKLKPKDGEKTKVE